MTEEHLLDDHVLPAAAYLTGAAADDVLAAAIGFSGGSLDWSRPQHVQYRPGSDLIVRYQAGVIRDGRTLTETLVAATTASGPPPGTVPVTAELPDGSKLTVGVWRWPFDPILAGLETAVTPHLASHALGDLIAGRLELDVVAYRPCERAVVRATGADGAELYLKVVAPHLTAGLAERHALLRAAGVPVPEVVAADQADGWLALASLGDDTLRARIKSGTRPWPSAGEYLRLAERLADVELPNSAPVRPRVADAPGHAAMLAAVVPGQRQRLEGLVRCFRDAEAGAAARPQRTIHGDLHEAQLVLRGDRIDGVLDVDDAGPGDPVDDLANLLAHLVYRATTSHDQAIADYATNLRRAFAGAVDEPTLELTTAAALVGLATGPYRIQQTGWERTVVGQIELAEQIVHGLWPLAHMRELSAPAHRRPTAACAA